MPSPSERLASKCWFCIGGTSAERPYSIEESLHAVLLLRPHDGAAHPGDDLRLLGAVEGPAHVRGDVARARRERPHRPRHGAHHHDAERDLRRGGRGGGWGAERPLRPPLEEGAAVAAELRGPLARLDRGGRARGGPRAPASPGLRAARDPERDRAGRGPRQRARVPAVLHRLPVRRPRCARPHAHGRGDPVLRGRGAVPGRHASGRVRRLEARDGPAHRDRGAGARGSGGCQARARRRGAHLRGGGGDGGAPAAAPGAAAAQPRLARAKDTTGREPWAPGPSCWHRRAALQPCATMSFSSFDTLNTGTLRGGTGTASPVRGLRAMRDLRSLTRKVPKPRISMWWPCASARATAFRNESTVSATSFLVSPVRSEI